MSLQTSAIQQQQNMPDCPNAWVAEDPTQPGTAFAICDADPKYEKEARGELAHWKAVYGVEGRLMNKTDAKQWLVNWDRAKSSLAPIHM